MTTLQSPDKCEEAIPEVEVPGSPTQEEDVPLSTQPSVDPRAETVMPKREQYSLEDRMKLDKHLKEWKLKGDAFKLIVYCLIFLGVLYGLDTLIVNCSREGWKGVESSLTNPLFETLKFMVSALIGYLFSINKSD